MEYMVLFYIFLLIWLLPFSFGLVLPFKENLTNRCLLGINHKHYPGPEDNLYLQCRPWKNKSCCTRDTTLSLHSNDHYHFNFDHCSRFRNMSTGCKKHFIQDLCFYECTPNGGPWIVKVDMKIRKEKYQKIPLCASSCEAWFEACRDDFTCTDNWVRNFIWTVGGNKCIDETVCQKFQDVYQTAENFCEKVWDNSWTVVPDTEKCMKLWFAEEKKNPNEKVTEYYAEKMLVMENAASSLSLLTFTLYINIWSLSF